MTNRDKFLAFCRQQVSKPYVLGSTGPATFDCSGLFYCALTTLFAAQTPRLSTDQYALGFAVEMAQIEPGDLLFFDTGWTERVPNHNGVCIGDGKMINANSHSGKVVEESFATGYWSSRITGVRRIFDKTGRLDLFGKNTQAAPFLDVPQVHPDFAAIERLRKEGIVRGFANGDFCPDQDVTRAEALKIILLAFEIPLADADADLFSDVGLTDWHIVYVSTAKARGIINGYGDGTFRPAAPISRAEICKVIFVASGQLPPSSVKTLADVPADAWFHDFAMAAVEHKMFPLVGKKFVPDKSVTRGEMCTAIVRFLEYANG